MLLCVQCVLCQKRGKSVYAVAIICQMSRFLSKCLLYQYLCYQASGFSNVSVFVLSSRVFFECISICVQHTTRLKVLSIPLCALLSGVAFTQEIYIYICFVRSSHCVVNISIIYVLSCETRRHTSQSFLIRNHSQTQKSNRAHIQFNLVDRNRSLVLKQTNFLSCI